MSDLEPDDEPASSASARELASVQATARWLIGAGAAILAALVAGLQLSSLGQLTFDSTEQLALAVGAFAVALLSVLALLILAARVLIHPGWTLDRMTDFKDAKPQKWLKYWLRRELSARRGLLITDPSFNPTVLFDRQRTLLVAWARLYEIGQVDVADDLSTTTTPPSTHTYRADNDSDVQRLSGRLANSRAETNRVEVAANLIVVRRRYRLLVRLLPVLGLAPTVALLALLWTNSAMPAEVRLTSPVRVTVHLSTNPDILNRSALPESCEGLRLSGVAVAGTLSKPVVVSDTNTACTLNQILVRPDLGIVTPEPPK